MKDEDGKKLWGDIKRRSQKIAKKQQGWGRQETTPEKTIAGENTNTATSAKTKLSTISNSEAVRQTYSIASIAQSYAGIKDLTDKDLENKDLGAGQQIGGLHRRLAQRLRRGAIPIEVTIDLHGMTRAAAAAVLREKIPRGFANGARCLLVITGKGRGLLRDDLPMLLNSAGLRELVLSHCLAHNKDGGAGARYVLLRKKRRAT